METMIELREYQKKGATDCCSLLQKYHIAYLAWEVRLGKTLTALKAADLYGAKKVLFLTKKKAVESGTILNDYELLKPNYTITIINNESIHKITDNDFDMLISDEHHRNGSFPKPNKKTKVLKQRFGHLPMIFLSGTPAPESGSQYYHQFWISEYSPFHDYKNFYGWAQKFVEKRIKYLGSIQVTDYSHSRDELINDFIKPYMLKLTQEQAGFKTEIKEHVIYYDMPQAITDMTEKIMTYRIIEGKCDNIVADTAAAMMTKIHQIENGTVITESGNAYILNKYKTKYIMQTFAEKKIAIFYYYQKELDLLKDVFGDKLTTDLNEFNTTDKNFAVQQISGSEAISLKAADALVYYNWGFSGKNYIQGRDRMTTMDRQTNNVYFVVARNSLSEKIYKAIRNKKRYNDKMFIKDYGRRTKFAE
ncbi:MAG: hypothetical protein ACYC2P_08795 [Paludibacteraceae bacterium]